MSDASSPDERRALLADLLRQRRDGRRERPVSSAQRRLWFLDQLLPDGSLYNICFALTLRGRLDVSLLEGCLDAIIARHEVLRTTFEARDGEPVQRVGQARPLGLEHVDCRAVLPAERAREIRRWARDLGRRPIDLARGPLVRGRLLRVQADEHVLLVVIHHIAFDGWSSAIFMDELTTLYAAGAAGRQAALPPLPIQYGDHAAWQAERLGDEALAVQLGYWTDRLEGAAVLDLPTDHVRPRVPHHASERRSADVEPAVVEALERLGRERALAICRAMTRACSTGRGPCAMRSASVGPSTSSITRAGPPSPSSSPWIWAMCG
jgi:hypothetical protein